MIYLYSLPGLNLTYPEITNPMIKGNLKMNKVESKQVDLTIDFIDLLSQNKEFANLVKMLKSEDLLFEDRLDCNEKIRIFIGDFLKQYNLDYIKKKIVLKKNINTIDKLLEFLATSSKELEVFDSIFNINHFKDNDYLYINVAYDFQFPYALRLASKVKKSKNVKIIMGGNYLTHIKENILEFMEKYDDVDAIHFYASYDSLLNIISFYDNSLESCNADCFLRVNDKIVSFNSKSLANKDMTVPDFSDLALEKYLSYKIVVPMLLSKGCYYGKCNFCAHHYFYRCNEPLDINKICECVLDLYNNYDVKGVIFVDECINPKNILHFASYLIEKNIKINWLMETRISDDYLSDENCKLLEKSGCKLITFGVESASQRVLNLMNKGIEFKKAKAVLKKVHAYNIIVSSTYIIGYPNERKYEMYKTLNFLKKCKYLDGFGLSVFNFVRNSKIAINSKIDGSKSLDLIYSYKGQNAQYLHEKLVNFYSNDKVKRYKMLRDKVLNRSDYLFLNKKDISLNKICNMED